MSGKPSSTLGFERRFNPLLSEADSGRFAQALLARSGDQPARMNEMISVNSGRTPPRLDVRFALVGSADGTLEAFAHDLSVKGICLKTAHPLAQGARIVVTVQASSGALEVPGTVAWMRDGAAGVDFEVVAPPIRDELAALAASLSAARCA